MKIAKPLTELIVPIDSINPREGNPRQGDLGVIKESLEINGQYRPIVVNKKTNEILAGNHTYQAAKELGWSEIAATWVEATEEEASRIVLVDNRANDLSTYDDDLLARELESLDLLLGTGYLQSDLDDLLNGDGLSASPSQSEVDKQQAQIKLIDRFIIPPLSVIDTRQAYWIERKRAWKQLGIKSELGRDGDLVSVGSGRDPSFYKQKQDAEKRLGRELSTAEFKEKYYVNNASPGTIGAEGTSIFDPVLCELIYKWFCPNDGVILDPFAGGSVRGIVASYLGREYHGIELRPEQVVANREQADEIIGADNPFKKPLPTWYEGDARDTDTIAKDVKADLIFTCPPYGDLEIYSDDVRDLSTMTEEHFDNIYSEIIRKAVGQLKPNRFAAIVVGDYRRKDGTYANFVSKTISAFESAGAKLYNDAVLLTPVGPAAMRSGKVFEAGRKLSKVHQNVLIFTKGETKPEPLNSCEAIIPVDDKVPVNQNDFGTARKLNEAHQRVLVFIKGNQSVAMDSLDEVDTALPEDCS